MTVIYLYGNFYADMSVYNVVVFYYNVIVYYYKLM